MGLVDQQKSLIEKAAETVAMENTELASAFIQKTAMEKAVPEMDKRLSEVRHWLGEPLLNLVKVTF